MMTSYRRLGYRNFPARVLSLALGIVMFSAALALAAPQRVLTCDDCHTMPPLDSSAGKREPETGAFKGNHQSHAGTTAATCVKCHSDAVLDYAAGHRDKTIQVQGNINGSPAGASYVTGRPFLNQTTVPVAGNCSNVNCHFESVTPAWGSDKSATNCDTCHQAQPGSGSHGKHISYLGGGTSVCASCHPAHAGFSHATSAANRGVQVTVGASYSGPGQTYSGTGENFLPSQSGARNFGSCSSVNCHDDGTGNLKPTPTWGTPDSDCSICHARRPNTGSHQAHLGNTGIGCGSCHNGAVEATTPSSLHVNGKIDVFKVTAGDLGYPVSKTKGTAYASCNTASCHNNGQGGQLVSPVWGSVATDRCGGCHLKNPTTGSHTAHFDAGFTDCANCHKGAADGSTPPELHVNGVIDVYNLTPGDLGYPQSKAYGTAGATCSSGKCHDDGTGRLVTSPAWGTTVPNCSACHKTVPTTDSHSAHINDGVTCNQCHKGAVSGTTAPDDHMNGYIKVWQSTYNSGTGMSDLGYPFPKAKGSPKASCSGAACHGTLSKVWGDASMAGANTCTKCHGKVTALANYSSNNRQAAPGYGATGVNTGQVTGTITSGVSADAKVGAHDTHLRALNNLGKPVSCSDCHTVPATPFYATHMTGSTNMTWSNLVKNQETVSGSGLPFSYSRGSLIPNYDAGTGQCSNTYCHGAKLPGGTGKSPAWTDGSYLTGDRAHDCSQCHGYPPTSGEYGTFAHNPADTTCSNCHPHNGTRESTDPLVGRDLHMNGKVEANNHCNTCHDYDTRGTDGSLWGNGTPMGVEGFGVHAMHINYLKSRMGVTGLDPNADAFGQGAARAVCGTCHTNDASLHRQTDRTALRNVTFGDSSSVRRQFGPNPPHYNGITNVSSGITLKTCSNIDCHYKSSPIWSPF